MRSVKSGTATARLNNHLALSLDCTEGLIMRFARFHRPRLVALVAFVGLLSLGLSACAGDMQYDPAGQNSGSPENAQGTFNFPVNGVSVVNGTVGQAVNVYDSFTTVTTAFTVNSAQTMSASANLNANTYTLPADEQFLVLNLTMQNTSGSATGCGNPKVNNCVEYLSPLQNFRLQDSAGRDWPSTTGPLETCTNAPHTICADRAWATEARGGVPPVDVATKDTLTNEPVTYTSTFTTQLAFIVPRTGTVTLYFAPYRFTDVSANVAGGNASGKKLPTVAAITITL